MITENEKVNHSSETDKSNETVFSALEAAVPLYDRYIEIVALANTAALRQNLAVSNPNTKAPLGLVVWPKK